MSWLTVTVVPLKTIYRYIVTPLQTNDGMPRGVEDTSNK